MIQNFKKEKSLPQKPEETLVFIELLKPLLSFVAKCSGI